MDTIESIDNTGMKKEPRPTFLTVLCILSLIWLGLSLLTDVANLAVGPKGEEQLAKIETDISKSVDDLRSLDAEGWAQFVEKLGKMEVITNQHHYGYYLTTLLTALLGITGVIFMLRGRKLGFHFYIIYSLFNGILLYFFVPSDIIPPLYTIASLLLSGIFILMYSRNLKWLI